MQTGAKNFKQEDLELRNPFPLDFSSFILCGQYSNMIMHLICSSLNLTIYFGYLEHFSGSQ